MDHTRENSNRLLALLNSATSSPSHIPSNPLSPPTNTNPVSPREPSPFPPPPPSLQSVTLQDLFKNIAPVSSLPPASPPVAGEVGGSKSPAGPAGSPGAKGNEQASKLLGMLKGLGTPPSGASASGTGGVSTPGMDPAILNGGAATLSGHQSASSKAETSKSPAGESAPVITHPQPTASAHSPPPRPSTPSVSSPKPPTEPSMPSVAAAGPKGPPKKSIFDFVSPFDVFDAPKSKTTPPVTTNKEEVKSRVASVAAPKAATKAKVEVAPPLPTAAAVQNAPAPALQPQSSNGPTPIPIKDVKAIPPVPITAQSARPPSASGSTVPTKDGLGEKLPYSVKKIVGSGTGKGPKTMTGSTSVRLDKPNLDALVSDKDAIQVTPFAKLNTDLGEWHHGRTVGLTPGWVAYALHKGRVRLMDRTSGAKLVLQLPSASSVGGTIIDIATTPTRIAVVGSNHAVTVWNVPSSWTSDDPPVEEVAHLTPDSPEIGLPERVEWVKRNGQDCLAIGGRGGVVIAELKEHQEFLSQVVEGSKVLTTDGEVVSFAINSLGQAIALLSSTNHLSLYNISTLNRVWHRKLPLSPSSSEDDAPPSSIQFCESMLLVGRSNDTIFDLVQITVDLSVLCTLSFQIPPPGFSTTHFGRAVYDHTNRILWASQFGRGSLYAFHFSLAGRPPVRTSDGEKVVAFDRMAEYPLDHVSHMALASEGNAGVEIFYATPSGVSLATISKDTITSLESPAGTIEAQANGSVSTLSEKVEPAPQEAVKAEPTENKKAKATPQAKAAPKMPFSPRNGGSSLPNEVEVKEEKVSPEKRAPLAAQAVGLDEDLQKALKKMEDRLITQFRQAISQQVGQVNTRIDALASEKFANEIAAKMDKAIKASVASAIQNENKKSALPAITSAIQSEIAMIAAQVIPSSVAQSLREMPSVVEKALAPGIQRAVSVTVMQSMDRSISEAIQRSIIPTISSTVDHTVGTISKEIRGELLQIRKDLSPSHETPPQSSEPLIRELMTSVSQLQKQLADLTAQISRGAPSAPSGLAGPSHSGSTMSLGAPFAPAPPPALPSPTQLEEVFLGSLSQVSTSATVGLINEYWGMTDYVLPLAPGQRSPLTQAILLTLLHRISLALAEIPPLDPIYPRAIAWERRAAHLLDTQDPNTASYLGRIIPMVQSGLANVLQNMGRFGGDGNVQRQMGEVRAVLDILGSKA